MSKDITRSDVLRQLKDDLIGKDSHRGVTFTYTWLANQFGHISLGFIPALIVYTILCLCHRQHEALNWAAWGVAGVWSAFELYNFLGPLLSNRVSHSKRLFIPSSVKYVFQPAWGNIAFDTCTDVCFFWLGAFSARLYTEPTLANGYMPLGLLLILLLPCRYWYLTKLYLQAAGYPFQCRISQWAFAISEADKQLVEKFLQTETRNKHLLIFGELGNGKTSLAVGIATEHSIRHETCFYTTGMKLYSLFPDRNSKSFLNKKNLWTWRQASLLVIDDINPGGLIDDLITPEQFLDLLNANPNNRKTLANKDVIWVLGNDNEVTLPGKKWADILRTIGVEEKDIYSIHLPAKRTALDPQGKI